MRAERERDLEAARTLQVRDQEISRQRLFLRLIAEPLAIDIISKGDFREIAQILTKRVALAGKALNGEWPEKPTAVVDDEDPAPPHSNGDRA